MEAFSIVSLADHPEYRDACAAWEFSYWTINNPSRPMSLKDVQDAYAKRLSNDHLPITLVIINTTTNRPVGMGTLCEEDSDYWATTTPWIASLYIHELYRSHGLFKKLMEALENKAIELGLKEIYLSAIDSVAPLYKNKGYQLVETREAPEKHGKIEHLFKKNLS